MKLISVGKGRYAKVDNDDFDNVKAYRWYVMRNGYVRSEIAGYLARYIMKTPKDLVCDHINHDLLDNRKSNLRNCTISENNMNRKLQKNNKSGYAGITWHKAAKRWDSRIKIDGKMIVLGYFKNIEDAIFARKEAENKYFGLFSFTPQYRA